MFDGYYCISFAETKELVGALYFIAMSHFHGIKGFIHMLVLGLLQLVVHGTEHR